MASRNDVCLTTRVGIEHLRDARLFKGMAFTLDERQSLGIHGLLPPRVKTQAEQVDNCLRNIRRYEDPLNKYLYLSDLQVRNERLFYRLVSENLAELMPVVYTPTVGLACQKFGYVFRRPQGLFVTVDDKGHVYNMLKNWPENDVKAVVVTDGERVLGLGDLGAHGMGIPVGKLALYTALAGIEPHQTLPVTIDVGTDNGALLGDEDYVGIRKHRVRGREYDDLIDEFMEAVVRRYGRDTLIQFEDFGNRNAFRLLQKYRRVYCTFNDDIQGTGAVAVAGILASLRYIDNGKGKLLSEQTFLFYGAGQANLGIANLLVRAMEKREKIPPAEGATKIWLVDSKGLVVKDRPSGGLNSGKEEFAHQHAPMTDLHEIIKVLRPTALVGATAVPGVFTPRIIELMAALNRRPIIFALSNPTARAECSAQQAYRHSEGRAVFASGSPSETVEHDDGRRFRPGQANNAYIFPGVALGVISAGIRRIDDDVFLRAAESLAAQVTEEDLEVGRIYPALEKVREVSLRIAADVAEDAYVRRTASLYPEPENKLERVSRHLYRYDYREPFSKL